MNKLTNKLNLKKGQSGFTIIEVLIVLAIGALIILAVLLAVPALQTNQKNSARKAEAARLVGAVSNALADSNNSYSALSNDNLKSAANLGSGQLTSVVKANADFAADTPAAKSTIAYVVKGATCTNGVYTWGDAANNTYVVVYNNSNDTAGTKICLTVQ